MSTNSQGNFGRKYTLTENKKGIVIVMKWERRGYARDSRYEELQDRTNTEQGDRIQTCGPDLIVTVGSGDATESFLCHKHILALVSPTLDSCVSEASEELRFTKMKPQSWKKFYECIDPKNNGPDLCSDTCRYDYSGPITELIPWFHLFNMNIHLDHCNTVIAKDIEYFNSVFEERYSMGEGKCQWVMTSLLKFVVENDLKDLQERAENVFETWFGDRNLIRNEDDLLRDLDSGVAKDLVSLWCKA
jgi:hypothetical protein